MIHELKIHNKFFAQVVNLDKRFEVRKNDRNFQEGDFLALNEIDENGAYTGQSTLVRVTYILNDSFYCKDDMVIMSIEPCAVRDEGKRDMFTGGEMKMQVLSKQRIGRE